MTRFLALTLALASLSPAFAQVPDYVPTEGLVGWWPFNGNANDQSQFGNNGQLFGATSTSDRFGNENAAFHFNGSQWIMVPHHSSFSIPYGEEISWSVWLQVEEINAPLNIFEKWEGGNSYSHLMLRAYVGGNGQYLVSTAYCNPVEHIGLVSVGESSEWENAWTHIAFRSNGTLNELFINGVLRSSVTDPRPGCTDTSNLTIGRRGTGNPNNYIGKMDDMGIWNRMLSVDEIMSIYESPGPNVGCTDPSSCNWTSSAIVDNGSCASCATLATACGPGTIWNSEAKKCVVANPSDSNFDGCVQLNDLLDLLGAYGQCSNEQPCEAVSHEGYEYATFQIDGQCWFAENLRTTTYANGDTIDAGLNDAAWGTTAAGARTTFGEGSSDIFIGNDDEVANATTYGHLYNSHAVTDVRGLCPTGWHVPTDAEWMDLELALGMPADTAMLLGLRGTDEGAQIKSTSLWADGGNGTNTSGFAGLPAGIRATDGSFQSESTLAVWWSSTPHSESGQLLGRAVYSWNDQVSRGDAPTPQEGYSVRCLKD